MEAVEPDGRVRHDHDRAGGREAGDRDRDDRRDPCEGPPDCLESGGSKEGRGRLIGRTKGGLNSKLHVVTDAKGRPIRMFLLSGQTSDYIGARALLSSIPQAGALLADRGYDADWFRNALINMGITPCIPSRIGQKVPISHDADLYRQRHKIENLFARLKYWRLIATRYDRCPILFLSACALAATVIYWL
jgi:transposase